ncbi:MAG: substrate-binding domain-containing protein [Candidatus Methylomirabilia bacterium]
MTGDRSTYLRKVAVVGLLLLLLVLDGASRAVAQGPEDLSAQLKSNRRTQFASALSSGPLLFAGSGLNLAITRILAKAFSRVGPGIEIKIPASIGSSGGIRASGEGAVTVGLVSRPLKERERKFGLTVMPYAQTALVIGAHPAVPDDGITFEELIGIYKGAKTRWRNGRDIIVLTRDPGESSIQLLAEVVPGFKKAYEESKRANRWITLFTDQEMNDALIRTPDAIGLSDLGTIRTERLPIKILKVNGVLPTPESVRSGKYPFVRTLAFVFLKDRVPDEARAFLDFVRSAEGEKILIANGYVLVK